MPRKPRSLKTVRESLWPRIAIGGRDECWPWKGERDRNGYGVFRKPPTRENPRTGAHRAAYTDRVGPIPDGLFVLHKCDNPPCCNPDHLFLGDQLANMRDAANKGRTAQGDRAGWVTQPDRVARGERHMSKTRPEAIRRGDDHHFRIHPQDLCRGQDRPQAKLNDESVREIRRRRAAGELQRDLAVEFGVSKATISNVVNHKMSWKHVA